MSEFWYGLIWLTLFIPLMFLWGFALWDIFSRHDLSGLAKALWALAIILVPFIGMLVYFIARPKELASFGGYVVRAYPYGYPYGSPRLPAGIRPRIGPSPGHDRYRVRSAVYTRAAPLAMMSSMS